MHLHALQSKSNIILTLNRTPLQISWVVSFEGVIEIPEYEEELLKENPHATIVTDDNYEITDYDVKEYHHSGDCTPDYRKWMYKKFGNEYAVDYLLRWLYE